MTACPIGMGVELVQASGSGGLTVLVIASAVDFTCGNQQVGRSLTARRTEASRPPTTTRTALVADSPLPSWKAVTARDYRARRHDEAATFSDYRCVHHYLHDTT